jgi:hypothetical protein
MMSSRSSKSMGIPWGDLRITARHTERTR